MSMSLTGRHHDWLPLAPSSIRPNGIQARYGVEGPSSSGGRQKKGWPGQKFSVGIALLCFGMLNPVARQEDV